MTHLILGSFCADFLLALGPTSGRPVHHRRCSSPAACGSGGVIPEAPGRHRSAGIPQRPGHGGNLDAGHPARYQEHHQRHTPNPVRTRAH